MSERRIDGNRGTKRFESVGDLLRSMEPLPDPPREHIAHLNRLVRKRIEHRHGLGRLWAWLGECIAPLWYHPLGERGLVLAGTVGVLCAGLWIGSALSARESRPADIAMGGIPTDLLGPEAVIPIPAPVQQSEPSVMMREVVPPVASSSDRMLALPDSNPFPSVYVMSSGVPEGAAGNWATLAGLQPTEALRARPEATARMQGLIGTLRPADPAVETPVNRAAQTIVEEDLLGDLRRFKLDLYLSGETDMIPRVQRIEEVLYQVLASQTGSFSANSEDLEAQRQFTEAEGYLLRRDFRRAEELFNDIAHAHSGTRLANLSWYHLGDIYHDFHSDYAGARQCYERCLEGQPEEVFPPETLERVEHRLALLQDGAGDGYEAIRLLRQAEAAPAEEAVSLYRHLLTEHPASLAVVDGINSLAERGLAQIPTAPNLPYEAIDLLRECQTVAGFENAALAQLRLADIVFFRLGDYSQALIEYGEVEISPDDTALESMVRDRIAQILDSRITQRDF